MRTLPRFAGLFVLAVLLLARSARADPWFGFGENAAEDRFVDGDIDADDAAQLPSPGRARVGSSGGRAKTWLTLLAFTSQFPTGAHEVGAGVILGIAFDKIGQGPIHVASERPPPFIADGASPSPSTSPSAHEASTPAPTLDSTLARGAVRAAWRTAGIEVTDVRVDEMIARAHRSATWP
jgi:hypothetical protein